MRRGALVLLLLSLLPSMAAGHPLALGLIELTERGDGRVSVSLRVSGTEQQGHSVTLPPPAGCALSAPMVERLEGLIDHTSALFDLPTEFVVPGESVVAAQLDVARTATRRAERDSLGVEGVGTQVLAYLNRLSDLLWTLARWVEGESLTARSVPEGDAAFTEDPAANEPAPNEPASEGESGVPTDG